VITSVRQLKTRKGDRMAVFVLEDQHGTVEVVTFPDAYSRAAALIQPDSMVLVKGRLEQDAETARVQASEVVAIEAVRERAARELTIALDEGHGRETFEALAALFAQYRGECRVAFDLRLAGRLRVRADVIGQIRVRPATALVEAIERQVGPGSVTLR
jgi:DNA polymerase-3 subunit alpha